MPADRTVLAIDLSTPRGVIAVVRGDAILFEAAFQSERSHNAQVFAPLAEALAVIPEEEKATLVVGTGPGSYTGVRISIAAAQGVALARGWPVLGWPSIATAEIAGYQVLGDARRGQFYHASIQAGHMTLAPQIITADEAATLMTAGDTWLSFDTRPPLGLAIVTLAQPQAATLGRFIAQLPESEIESFAARPLEPFYLQEAFITVARKAGKQVASR